MSVQAQWMEAMGKAIEHFFKAEAWQDLMQSRESIKKFYEAKLLVSENLEDLRECDYICQRMLYAAQTAGETFEVAEWSHHRAVVNHSLANYPVAIQSCKQGIEIASRVSGKDLLHGHLLHRLGMLMECLGKDEEAGDLYKRALQFKRKVGDEAEIASTERALREMEEKIRSEAG
jgi:tetratricopeptide (TPR) repeat protein